ncbi:MAG: radical SAM protein [Elusimicrobiales bacterium]|nr:radical SAM protein [Elusimicrobiales bacterium]
MIQKKITGWLLNLIGAQTTILVQLDITNACNLRCRHCYQGEHSAAGDLSLDKWREILGQVSALAEKLRLTPHFCLSGGEPTISPLFLPLLRELRGKYPDSVIAVLSNGTALTREAVREIAAARAKVQLSLEGPAADSHDFIRGQGSFEKTMRGLGVLRESGVYVTFQAVLSKRTAGFIGEFFDLAARSRVEGMNFARFVPQGQGRNLYDSGGDAPLYKEALKAAYLSILEASKRTGVYTTTNRPLFVLISPELGMNNKTGFRSFVIDYLGNLKVSSRVDFRLGNVLESGLEPLFMKHPVLVALRQGKVEVCAGCRFREKCGGDRNASFEAYGTFFKKDPGCWL